MTEVMHAGKTVRRQEMASPLVKSATMVVGMLLFAGTLAAAEVPMKGTAFPHVAKNQNRIAAQISRHADGCTICTEWCTDQETGEKFACHCTDYMDCGGFPPYDLGCSYGSICDSAVTC